MKNLNLLVMYDYITAQYAYDEFFGCNPFGLHVEAVRNGRGNINAIAVFANEAEAEREAGEFFGFVKQNMQPEAIIADLLQDGKLYHYFTKEVAAEFIECCKEYKLTGLAVLDELVSVGALSYVTKLEKIKEDVARGDFSEASSYVSGYSQGDGVYLYISKTAYRIAGDYLSDERISRILFDVPIYIVITDERSGEDYRLNDYLAYEYDATIVADILKANKDELNLDDAELALLLSQIPPHL